MIPHKTVDEPNYTILSEPELERRFADLCLLRRPDARSGDLWDVLLEFKYLSLDAKSLCVSPMSKRL